MDEFGKFFQEMGDNESDLEDSTAPKSSAPLKRKNGQFRRNKPGKDGLCRRHSKEPRQ